MAPRLSTCRLPTQLLAIQLILLVFLIAGSHLILRTAAADPNASASNFKRGHIISGYLNPNGGPETTSPNPHSSRGTPLGRRRMHKACLVGCAK